MSDKKWIQEAIKKPGALHKTLGIKKDEDIPFARLRAAAKKKGKTGKRAQLAITLRNMQKGE